MIKHAYLLIITSIVVLMGIVNYSFSQELLWQKEIDRDIIHFTQFSPIEGLTNSNEFYYIDRAIRPYYWNHENRDDWQKSITRLFVFNDESEMIRSVFLELDTISCDYNVVPVDNGNAFIFYGSVGVFGNNVPEEHHWQKLVALKLSSNLRDTIWYKTYDYDLINIPISSSQLPDGGLILCGNSQHIKFMLRLDSNGDTLWSRLFDSENPEDYDIINRAVIRSINYLEDLDMFYITSSVSLFGGDTSRTVLTVHGISGNSEILWTENIYQFSEFVSFFRFRTDISENGNLVVPISSFMPYGITKLFNITVDGHVEKIIDFSEHNPLLSVDSFARLTGFTKMKNNNFIASGIASVQGNNRRHVAFEMNEYGEIIQEVAFWPQYNFIEYTNVIILNDKYIVRWTSDNYLTVISAFEHPFQDVSVPEANTELPASYYLSAAYPNPFNNETRISYGLASDGKASVKVYDIAGRLVSTLVDSELNAGNHNAVWNAEGFTTGVYFVKMETATFTETRKVVLMK